MICIRSCNPAPTPIHRSYSALFYVSLSVGDGLFVTLCHPGSGLPAATGEVCGARDWVEGAWSRFRQSARHVTSRACPQAAIVVVCLPKCARRGQTELMRVVVTLIGPDGTMRRRMVDTAASSDTGPWEELLTRALAARPPYRAVPGGAVYHLRVDDQVVLVAEQDLSGPLSDLITAVLAIGEPPH
jgi:hypothetical protein